MGPPIHGIDRPMRKLVVMRWLALYALEKDEVKIVRVVDSAMDMRRLLRRL